MVGEAERTPAQGWHCLALLALVAGVYAVAFPGSFFPDDVLIVQGNQFSYHLDLKGIFTSDYWGAGANSGLFRPLTILSFNLNRMAFGAEPWGYLLVNILLHALVATLLYRFLLMLNVERLPAWFAAALFAVHPLHGEPVIELVGRSELLAALFVLLALIAGRRDSPARTVAVAGCYLGAILAKEHGIVLLALLPVVDLYLGSTVREMLRRRGLLLGALIVLTIAWLLYRSKVVHAGIPAGVVLDPYYIPLGQVDAPTRILSALKLQLVYLGKLLIPLHLQGMYPATIVHPLIGWTSPWIVAIGAVLAAAAWGAWRGLRTGRLWGMAIVLYAVSFAPTSNVFFAAGFTMADRVAYLPSLWFCVGASLLLWDFLPQRISGKQRLAVCLLLVALYGIAGVARSLDFKTPETLWLSDLRINPRNPLSLMMLTDYYRATGRMAEAGERGRELVALAPDFDRGLSLYAGVLVELERPQEAIRIAQRAIALSTRSVSTAKIPLAAAYLAIGSPGKALEALANVQLEDRLRPVYWELYGRGLEMSGDLVGALQCYRNELSSSGERSFDTFFRIARILQQIGQDGEALEYLRKDVEINPLSAAAWNRLGVGLSRAGKSAEASQAFSRAVELDGTSAEFRTNLERSRQAGAAR